MKIGKLMLCALASVALFTSCENEEDNLGAPSISVSPNQITFEQAGGSAEVQITATRDWKATCEVDWLVVEPASGSATSEPVTVTVTAIANEDADRNANIVFSATNGTVSQSLTVSQTGAVATTYATIASIKESAPESTDASVTIPDGTKVKGVVVLGSDLNNATSLKNIYVQDETAGIQIRFDGNSELKFGDEVEVDLSGQELAYYAEALQINNLPNANATVLSSGNTVEPVEASMSDFLANKYEGRYVALAGVQVVEADLDKTFVMDDSHTSIKFEDAQGNTFIVFSSRYSTYGDTAVPQGSGTLKGVATKNYDDIQIMFAQVSDFEGLTGSRFEGSEVQPVSGSIADVLNAEKDTPVETEGIVAGIYKSGMVITDGTDNLLVYNGQSNFIAPDVKIGDEVRVSGTRTSYGELPQMAFSYDNITVLSSGNEVKYPEPAVIDASNIGSFDKSVCTYIRYTGTLSISGNYYNVAIDGTSVQGSLSYPLDELNLDQYEGKVATYTGYFCGGTNANFLNMLVVNVKSEDEGGEDPDTPEEPVEATVAEFLAAPVDDNVYYTLTGKITNIVNETYGNFTLVDETGEVYVYGLTATQVSSNDKSFSSLGLKEGDTVTLCGTRAEYNGEPQVGGPAYYISHEPGEDTPDEPVNYPFTSNVTWTLVENAYSEKATVNGEEDVEVLKLGATQKTGKATITVPAGTTSVEFFAVSWNNIDATLVFEMEGIGQVGSQAVSRNAGAANISPYTMTVTNDDHYVINTPMPLPTDMEVTVTTATQARVILWGINAK